MAKMNFGPKGSLLVEPGSAGAGGVVKTTIRVAKIGIQVRWALFGVHFGVLVAPWKSQKIRDFGGF